MPRRGRGRAFFATLEITYRGSVLKTDLGNSSNYTFEQCETVRIPFPCIFVTPTRVFQTTRNAATMTRTSIRSTPEVKFLGSLLKRELQDCSIYTLNRWKKIECHFLVISSQEARFQNHVQCRHNDTDEHSFDARSQVPRIPIKKGTTGLLFLRF